MSNLVFHPEQAIGEGLLRLDKQELLQFVSQLCLYLKAQVGSRAYHGGIFPENICREDSGRKQKSGTTDRIVPLIVNH